MPEVLAEVAVTPIEEYREATAPWVRCAWCGTLRPPSTLDESGACVDVKWCTETVRIRDERQSLLDREALMGWPRDYPALQRVEGLEVKAEFEVRPDDVGDPFPGDVSEPTEPRERESSGPSQKPPGSRR